MFAKYYLQKIERFIPARAGNIVGAYASLHNNRLKLIGITAELMLMA